MCKKDKSYSEREEHRYSDGKYLNKKKKNVEKKSRNNAKQALRKEYKF